MAWIAAAPTGVVLAHTKDGLCVVFVILQPPLTPRNDRLHFHGNPNVMTRVMIP